MAEINSNSVHKHSKAGIRKLKKLSTRVDLTPMVDLGFLLITFFIFTSALSEPTAMRLTVPKDSPDSLNIAKSKTLTLLLASNNKVFWYDGDNVNSMRPVTFAPTGLRQIIINKKNNLVNLFGNDTCLIAIIKPTTKCNYKNVVDALDEMHINNIHKYFLVDADTFENALISSKDLF